MPKKTLSVRLKSARESIGLTIIEAAARLGFASYQTLSKIEAGEREVKASELSKFAKVYFCSMGNLLGEEDKPTEYSFLWRDAPTDESVKKEIEAEILYRSDQYSLLERLLGTKVNKGFINVSIDDIRGNNEINILAAEVSDLLGLGNRPAFTLQKVLEQDYGVKIFFHPLSSGSAFSMVHPDVGSVIVINSNEAPWRRNYDLAHELFHLITWKVVNPSDLEDPLYFNEIEKKANKFASILLLPENEISAEVKNRVEAQKEFTYSDVVDIAMEFGASAVALTYRLANLRFIKWEDADESAHDEELAKISRNMRKEEWGEEPKPERFHSLAIRCLRKGLISRGKFAEIVNIDRSDIDEFISDKGLMEQEGNTIEIMAT